MFSHNLDYLRRLPAQTYRSHSQSNELLNLLMKTIALQVAIIAWIGVLNCSCVSAQRQGPVIGDIIQYERFRELRYGLVVEYFGSGVKVEYFDNDRGLRTDVVMGSLAKWEYVDRYRLPREVQIKPRKWSSANGQFTVIAKLSDVDKDKVQLEKQDGDQIVVHIDKLSERDRNYILKHRTEFSSTSSADVETKPDWPAAVLKLLQRRKELVARETRARKTAEMASRAKQSN